ncbi:MAG: hypothetical protein ACJ8G3_08105 [Burkholderiaceae bacterium]
MKTAVSVIFLRVILPALTLHACTPGNKNWNALFPPVGFSVLVTPAVL